MAEAQARRGEHTLKRALGPINLITLGIGAIIGAGIFVLTGTAAAQFAGPAIVLSYIIAGSRLRLRRAVLRRVRLHDSHCRHRPTPMATPPWASWWPGSSAGRWCWNTPSARPPWPWAGAASSAAWCKFLRRQAALQSHAVDLAFTLFGHPHGARRCDIFALAALVGHHRRCWSSACASRPTSTAPRS